jgi:hypothetical protein
MVRRLFDWARGALERHAAIGHTLEDLVASCRKVPGCQQGDKHGAVKQKGSMHFFGGDGCYLGV